MHNPDWRIFLFQSSTPIRLLRFCRFTRMHLNFQTESLKKEIFKLVLVKDHLDHSGSIYSHLILSFEIIQQPKKSSFFLNYCCIMKNQFRTYIADWGEFGHLRDFCNFWTRELHLNSSYGFSEWNSFCSDSTPIPYPVQIYPMSEFTPVYYISI